MDRSLYSLTFQTIFYRKWLTRVNAYKLAQLKANKKTNCSGPLMKECIVVKCKCPAHLCGCKPGLLSPWVGSTLRYPDFLTSAPVCELCRKLSSCILYKALSHSLSSLSPSIVCTACKRVFTKSTSLLAIHPYSFSWFRVVLMRTTLLLMCADLLECNHPLFRDWQMTIHFITRPFCSYTCSLTGTFLTCWFLPESLYLWKLLTQLIIWISLSFDHHLLRASWTVSWDLLWFLCGFNLSSCSYHRALDASPCLLTPVQR